MGLGRVRSYWHHTNYLDSCSGTELVGVCPGCKLPTPPDLGDVTFSTRYYYKIFGEWPSARLHLHPTRYFHGKILEERNLYDLTVREKEKLYEAAGVYVLDVKMFDLSTNKLFWETNAENGARWLALSSTIETSK